MISELELDKVVARIVEFYQPEQVTLFGSYAYGMPHEGSDLDLLIVKETNENPVCQQMNSLTAFLHNLYTPIATY